MGGVNLNKKLWRIPQQGMVKGVCAGIAHYLDVPVKLVRILVVLSGEQQPSSGELLDAVDRELAASEKRLREMERYVTSDTFTLRSRFRQL